MTTQPFAYLLIGSAKTPGESTSEALGTYLCHQLESYGWKTHTEHVVNACRTEQNTEAMLRTIDESDLFVISSPLHVDSLPYLVTRVMERIAQHRKTFDTDGILPTHFSAILNCGNPEPLHNEIAVEIFEQFAHQARFMWSGALSMGSGQRIGGRSAAHFGSGTSSLHEALEMAADSLAVGSAIPRSAIELFAKPVISPWLYKTIGSISWYVTAWRQGMRKKIAAKPLLE